MEKAMAMKIQKVFSPPGHKFILSFLPVLTLEMGEARMVKADYLELSYDLHTYVTGSLVEQEDAAGAAAVGDRPPPHHRYRHRHRGGRPGGPVQPAAAAGHTGECSDWPQRIH